MTEKDKKEDTNCNIKNKTGAITTDPAAIKKTVREYHKQFYTHTFDNLDEMDQFLEYHKLPKLIQDEIGNLSSPITVKEIEFII